MRKDDIKPGEFCPDCVNENTYTGNGTNDSNECCCCCCCCSCDDTGSESENNRLLPAESQVRLNIEQQKKALLSNLSILQTNQEPASVQHILQFVEALTHSTDFLRRYNLQEDFCFECLLSEPTCTCCTNGISQLNINDTSRDSCDECNDSDQGHNETSSLQECADCIASAKATTSRRQRTGERRARRRRRRQRNMRHNLPRISTQPFIPNRTSSPNLTRESSCANCPECQDNGRHSSESSLIQNDSHDSNCEECAREEASRHNVKMKSNISSSTLPTNTNGDFDFCEDCARESLPSSSSCSAPSCKQFVNRNRRHPNISRRNVLERENFTERSCTCCTTFEYYQRRDNADSNDQPKRKKASHEPECDQQVTPSASCSESDRNQSTECSCDDCRANSECSEESCEECDNHHAKKKNKRGKKK